MLVKKACKRKLPRYTPEQIQFLKKHITQYNCPSLTRLFNSRFKTSKKPASIYSVCIQRGLKFDPAYYKKHIYTPAEITFIKKNIRGRSYDELTAMFNKRFRHRFSRDRIHSFCVNRHLKNGFDCRFKPGHIPANKGRKGYCSPGSEKGWFRPGHPGYKWNEKPVGSERVTDGYVMVKISDKPAKTNAEKQRRWKHKHVVIWEKENGPVPKSHVVIFIDGNKRNFKLDNLMLIHRKELVRANQMGVISTNKEVTKAGIQIAAIKNLIAERRRCSIRSSRKKKMVFIDNKGWKVYVLLDKATRKYVSVREKNGSLQRLRAELPPRSTYELAQKELKAYAIKRRWQLA